MTSSSITPAMAYVFSAIRHSNYNSASDFTNTLGLRPEAAEQAIKALVQQGCVQDNGGSYAISNNADASITGQLEQFFSTSNKQRQAAATA
jgi:predicted transcriptional regulator